MIVITNIDIFIQIQCWQKLFPTLADRSPNIDKPINIYIEKKTVVKSLTFCLFVKNFLLSGDWAKWHMANIFSSTKNTQQTHPYRTNTACLIAPSRTIKAGSSSVGLYFANEQNVTNPMWNPHICQNWARKETVQACILGGKGLLPISHIGKH